MKVFLNEYIAQEGMQLLQQRAEVISDLSRIGEVDAIISRGLPVTREMMESAPHLKVIPGRKPPFSARYFCNIIKESYFTDGHLYSFFRPAHSSLTNVLPSTNTAPMADSASIGSWSSSAESRIATMGSM